jgi:hypothetical protein
MVVVLPSVARKFRLQYIQLNLLPGTSLFRSTPETWMMINSQARLGATQDIMGSLKLFVRPAVYSI